MVTTAPPHDRRLDAIVADISRRPDVVAVALHGSRARGTARPDSDVDLFVVTRDSDVGQVLSVRDGIEVDRIERSGDAWRERFGRERPTWAWAWSDARVLVDPTGAAAGLVDTARRRLATFRTSPAQRERLAAFWAHVRPKLAEAVHRGDPVETGWASTLSLPTLVETLFAVNDVVEPPASDARALGLLRDLPRPDGLRIALDRVFGEADPHVRASAQLRLIDALTRELADRAES